MMNAKLGRSLNQVCFVFSVLAALGLICWTFLALLAARDGHGEAAITFAGWGLGIFLSLAFSAACGKVLADIHGYFVWAQETALARSQPQPKPAAQKQPPPAPAPKSSPPALTPDDAWQEALKANPIVKRT